MRGWGLRSAVAALIWVVLYVALRLLDFGPHAVPLLLLVALGLAVWWLVRDALDAAPASWTVGTSAPYQPPGQDVVLASYLRILESHRAAREPGPALHDRLLALAAARLESRLGVPPDATTLDDTLGADWARLRREPERRLSTTEIDRLMTRIEEL